MSADPILSAARRLQEVLQEIALELAFVREGGGRRLALLLDGLEAESRGVNVPNPLRMAMAACRSWLDAPGSAGDHVGAEAIAAMNEWQPWMVEAVTAWQRGQPLPSAPALWSADSAATLSGAGPSQSGETRPAGGEAGCASDQEVAVLPEDGDAELWQMFCAEAHDLLQEVEQSVLVLETSPRDTERLNTLFRAFHTIKGNASVIKLVVLQRFTHEMESLLDLARRGTIDLGREAIDAVLQGADVIRHFVAEMEQQAAGRNMGRRIRLPIPDVIARVRAVIAGGTPEVPRMREPVVPAAAAVATAAEVAVAAPSPSSDAPTASPQPPEAPPAPVATGASIVRVDTLKLDGLIDLVGELVVAQSMVVQNPDVARLANPHLSWSLAQIRGITAALQRTALALRMVPIGGAFRKLTRLVRDLSGELGKEITLRLEGEETELDRTIVEELGDPLVHMIRNSADHGLESPAERAAAGKPRTGTITLRAFHQGGFIVIQISDDGRGLDADRIRRKAVERGLVRPDEPVDDAAAYELIFMPGFSTAEQVTGLSGRGVGMDVVRRNIERIRGKIEVDSHPGRGTTFTLYVPLTLAIIEGLIVGVGDQRYIVPTLSVCESFRPLPGAVTTVLGQGELVSVRGRLTPLMRLGRHLGTPAAVEEPTEGIVVVIEAGQDRRCLFVDHLLGKQEVVIKTLGDMFARQRCFAGAAILGDGRVGLILDVNSLVKMKPAASDAAA